MTNFGRFGTVFSKISIGLLRLNNQVHLALAPPVAEDGPKQPGPAYPAVEVEQGMMRFSNTRPHICNTRSFWSDSEGNSLQTPN